MRFLVDENLSVQIAAALRDAGHDAVHVLESGLGGAPDTDVSRRPVAEERAIVSADSDFTTMLAMNGSTVPSLILLRSLDHLAPSVQAVLLLANLSSFESDLAAGAVVSLGEGHLRVRRLPLL